MNPESLSLVSSELAQGLALQATKGAAAAGITWLLVAVLVAFVLGLVSLVVTRRRLRAKGRSGVGLTVFVVVGPLLIGMGLAAWAGFGFGAARGASLAIEEAVGAIGANELAAVLGRAEQMVLAAGLPSDALDADVVSKVFEPYLAKTREREAALAGMDLGARLPLLVERVTLEAAIGFAKSEVGPRISWHTLRERAAGPAVEQLRASTHSLLAPVRHAGMPLVVGLAALLLLAHGFAWWRAGQSPTTERTNA